MCGFRGSEERLTAQELTKAENNFNVVLQTANCVKNLRLLPGFNDEIIQHLVEDLEAVFALIRREMYRRTDGYGYSGSEVVATEGSKTPMRLQQNYYTTLCPLALLLKAVAASLTRLQVKVHSNEWGTIKPLRRLLLQMGPKLESSAPIKKNNANAKDTGCYPGLATCLLLHEHNSRFTVHSSVPRYYRLTGMRSYSSTIRSEGVTEMRRQCSFQDLQRVKAIEEYSSNILAAYNEAKSGNMEWDTSAIPRIFESIDGCTATFKTKGGYLRACVLDKLRFEMAMPDGAKDTERRINVMDRGGNRIQSCAEWEFFVAIMNDPDPESAPTPPTAAHMEPGMPKPTTWPVPIRNDPSKKVGDSARPTPEQRQTLERSRVQEPSSVPKKINKAKALTFDAHQPPKHPARGHIVIREKVFGK